jgi:uncharacterized OB-fold protein
MIVVDTEHPDGAHAANRPLPEPDNTTAEYWAAAARGELLFQRCTACGHAQFYPRALCTACAADVVWEQASGEGTVSTFTVIRQNLAPGFRELGPYVVAMVELAEGPRMMANITHVEPADVRVGLPVVAYAVAVGDGIGIPFWRPAT